LNRKTTFITLSFFIEHLHTPMGGSMSTTPGIRKTI